MNHQVEILAASGKALFPFSRRFLCSILFFCLMRKWLINQVKLTFVQSSLMSRIMQSMPSLRKYTPTPYLFSGLGQTVAASFGPDVSKVSYRREDIFLPELLRPEGRACCPEVVPSGQMSLDWVLHQNRHISESFDSVYTDPDAVVILVPGLTGDSEAYYIKRIAQSLQGSFPCSYPVEEKCTNLLNGKVQVVVFNPRGRGGNPVLSPLLYSGGYTEDLRRAVAHVHTKLPRAALYAAGFSLGSNYLAKYVAEEGNGCILRGLVALACPIDLLSMSNNLASSRIGRVIDPYLVAMVQRVRVQHEKVLSTHPRLDLARIAQAKTMAEFDHQAIAPMFGFGCGSDYYRASACGLYLASIRRPTLFLHAYNDPIIPGRAEELLF